MSRRYRLESALLPQGWTREVLVTVKDGYISRLEGERSETPPSSAGQIASPAERVSGFVVPGMPNAHSHAFQRAMTGSTEYRLSTRDSFWTWRQAMYALANRIEPKDLELLATQLFVEMLKSGYTSVAEFHYVHRRRDGELYAATNELWQ